MLLDRLTLQKLIRRRKQIDRAFVVVGILCTLLGLVTLTALLVDLAIDGLTRIDWQFMTSFPSRFAGKAGIYSAWIGTILVMLVTSCAAIPLGIAAGVYLEEYAKKSW